MTKLSPKLLIVPVVLIAIGAFAFMQFSDHEAKAEAQNSASIQPAAGEENAQSFLDTKDAWQVRCNDDAENARGQCEVVQRLSVQESGQRLIEFAIGFPSDQDNARGVFILPTGILLEPGLSMTIDESEPMSFKVRYCLPSGCFAFLSLNDSVLGALRKGSRINIEMTQLNGQKIKIPMPLNGISKALDEVG